MNKHEALGMYDVEKREEPSLEGVLEKIKSSPTRMYDLKNQGYNIDGCACPPCGCITDDLIVILSPAGIAGAGVAFVAASPF